MKIIRVIVWAPARYMDRLLSSVRTAPELSPLTGKRWRELQAQNQEPGYGLRRTAVMRVMRKGSKWKGLGYKVTSDCRGWQIYISMLEGGSGKRNERKNDQQLLLSELHVETRAQTREENMQREEMEECRQRRLGSQTKKENLVRSQFFDMDQQLKPAKTRMIIS